MDKPFSPSTDTPFKVENFFLQIIISKLDCKRPHTSANIDYSFSIQKDSREFEKTTDITVPADHTGKFNIQKVKKLNFMVNNYNPTRPNDFRLRMLQSVDSSRVKEVGEHYLDTNKYIDEYNISENGAFDLTVDLNEDFAADIQLYVSRTQHGLLRLVRNIKNPQTQKEGSGVEPPRIMRQRITENRKKMDEEAEKETRGGSKEKKFTRFSPRREVSQEKKQAQQFSQRRREEESKVRQEEEQKRVEVGEKPKQPEKKKEPVIKKEWIIPGAEEITKKIAQANQVKKKSSREGEASQEKTKADESSKITQKNKSKEKEKSEVTEASILEKAPFNPKLLIPLILVIFAAATYALFFRPAANEQGSKLGKPKKAGGKIKGKGKK